jgi:hypothetical protein
MEKKADVAVNPASGEFVENRNTIDSLDRPPPELNW